MSKKRKRALIEQLADAGMELASYASYSEIVGGIHQNRVVIREWCDTIFDLKKELEELEEKE